MNYYRIGKPDTSDLAKIGLSEILIESSSGSVTREVGIGELGVPVYMHPSPNNIGSFRGLLDLQTVNDLIGDAIGKDHFESAWKSAEELDRIGKLKRKI